MLFFPGSFLLCALVALVTFKVVKLQVDKYVNARKAARKGCLPPPTAPSAGLFGLRTLLASFKATREERGVQWIANTMNEVGKNIHTVRAQVLDYELILTRDTENVKAMLATQSNEYDIGHYREKTFKSLFGLGVMTARGQEWKHFRGILRPQFARDQLINLALFESHFQSLKKRLTVGPDAWTSKLDLSPLYFNMSLDVATEFLVGQSVYSQDPEARAKSPMVNDPGFPDLEAFHQALLTGKSVLDRRGAMAKYGWLLRSKEFPNACKTVQAFADYFVAKALKPTDEEKQANSMSGKFVLLHELLQETRDPLTLRNELLNVLHAARDTTASLAGWIIYFLVRYPDVLAKVRNEIAAKFPTRDANDITFKDLQSCQYLIHVVNEVIRYVAIVPMNERVALVDTTLPRGGGTNGTAPIFVPKGTQILIPTYAMQHREDIWGADVEEFKPSRWETRKFGWDFVPFGGGARQCMGQQFARTEAMYVTVRLLQHFDIIENMEAPGQPIKYHVSIENRSGTGVQVRLHERR